MVFLGGAQLRDGVVGQREIVSFSLLTSFGHGMFPSNQMSKAWCNALALSAGAFTPATCSSSANSLLVKEFSKTHALRVRCSGVSGSFIFSSPIAS